MKNIIPHLAILGVLLLAALGFVYGGVFNVAADDPHWTLTQRVLETARTRSVAVRADDISVPPLDDAQLVAMGAEHYAAMCTGCHMAPGVSESEMRQGLYPRPPSLAEHKLHQSPQETFWIIKHGFKMTGMPAWGITHDDRSIWGMVAFLRRLPDLSPDEYRQMVAQGSGHEHGEADHEHGSGQDDGSGEGDAQHSHERHEAGKSAAAPRPAAAEHDHSTHSHDEKPAAAKSGAPLGARTAEPIAVVERFFRLLSTGDSANASALLEPSVLIFESGGAERSRNEYASHHLGADSQFLKTVTHKLLSRTGDATGDLAWVATESRLTASGDKPADVVSTETMVLRKSAGGWRIVHIHWSSRPIQPASSGKT